MPESQSRLPEPFIKHRAIDVRFPAGFCIAATAIFLALQAFVLYLLGQPFLSETHSLMLWAGDVLSPENSQQLTDWYTPSHIIHGILFYAGLRLLFPRLTFWHRLVLAAGVEVAWEVVENTPMVIDHYRQQALAQGYVGDSIINSLSDTLAMVAGFFIAWRLPVAASATLVLFFEALTLHWIRDSLFLNILGFVWTPDFITEWQKGA